MTLTDASKRVSQLHANTLYVRISVAADGRFTIQAYCFTKNGGLLEGKRVARLQPRGGGAGGYLPPRPMTGFRLAAHVPIALRRAPVYRPQAYTLASETYASDQVSHYLSNQAPTIVAALSSSLLPELIAIVVAYSKIGVQEIHRALWYGRFRQIVHGNPVPAPRMGMEIVEALCPQMPPPPPAAGAAAAAAGINHPA